MRFNKVKFGAIYLTSTGLEFGTPCKLTVTGLDSLLMDKTGNVTLSADGTPHVQLVDNNKKGILIEISIESLAKAVFDSLVSAINAANSSGDKITVEVTGKTGNFNFDLIIDPAKAVKIGSFNTFWIKNVVIRGFTA